MKTIKRAYLLIGFFTCFVLSGFSQNQKISDSIEDILKSGDFDKTRELELLGLIVVEETDYDKQLKYSLQLIVLAKELDSTMLESTGYLQKGYAYQAKGDLTKALESYFDASKIAKDNKENNKKFIRREAEIDLAIADTYSIIEDYESSFKYYRESLKILETIDKPESLAAALYNFGDEFLKIREIDSAFHYNNRAKKIYEEIDNEIGLVFSMGNFGLIYAAKDDNENAEKNLNEAIKILSEYGAYSAVCEYLSAMSDIYKDTGNIKKALDYEAQSLDLAKVHGLKNEISNSYLKLSDLYEYRGSLKQAYSYYKSGIKYRDSVNNIATLQKRNNMRTENAVKDSEDEAKQLEEDKRRQLIVIIVASIGLLIIGFLAFKFLKQSKILEKQKGVIEYEKQRSEELLTNILPDETAEELKEYGSVKAKQFDHVSVLFTDFKSFTSQASLLTPEELVKSIDYYFSKFDEIIEKYKLEKIKTIGDAYMCAGGLPHYIDHQAAKVAQAGLEIAEFVKQTKRNLNHNLAKFDIRIGIHTGPVVAGVVGTKKFQYDIWGDAVNIAARMESSSVVGRVNVSEDTFKLLKEYDMFKLTSRGAIEVKGKGEVEMYFVDYKN
ncbi:hypothetical protein BTO05_02385 [Winogradskyella sp. PC-19]|nr:hypothetical protein BTO05_02385 [Winogradskyella sp. PC-19]